MPKSAIHVLRAISWSAVTCSRTINYAISTPYYVRPAKVRAALDSCFAQDARSIRDTTIKRPSELLSDRLEMDMLRQNQVTASSRL